jgi:hypothetical protein
MSGDTRGRDFKTVTPDNCLEPDPVNLTSPHGWTVFNCPQVDGFECPPRPRFDNFRRHRTSIDHWKLQVKLQRSMNLKSALDIRIKRA